MNPKRARIIKQGKTTQGPLVYWMSRDQRARDNWALLYAQKLAKENNESLAVIFCLVPKFLEATIRQYGFMLKGLAEVEAELAKKNIPFFLLLGQPAVEIPRFLTKHKVSSLVTDFDPLRIKRDWKDQVGKKVNITIHEVDTHNIVPCWIASPKQEFAAYTFRPKINKLLPEFLVKIPALKKHSTLWKAKSAGTDWDKVKKSLKVDSTVPEVGWLKPGEKAAHQVLRKFLQENIERYNEGRNDPNQDAQSNLSPYLHFGQISPQRAALEVESFEQNIKSQEAFLEELIVRRELSDNLCYYNVCYESTNGFPNWAKETLEIHRDDPREYLYSKKQFEEADTHDPLWNAAQMEMVKRGKMHGYMRMYWAKKILEWTPSTETAMKTAIYLNDKYELDGRDPNGYTGIAWSIGGVHDRAWGARPVFGKIRYMNERGCRSKFDVKAYIRKHSKE